VEIILSGMSSGRTGGLAFWLQLPGGSSLLGLAPLLFIFAIFYFLLIMPQQRKQKKWQLMLSELKNGDKIVTSGGLIGEVLFIKEKGGDDKSGGMDDRVTIKSGDTRVIIERGRIAKINRPASAPNVSAG